MTSRANSLRVYTERLQEMAEDHPDIADITDDLIEFAEQWEAELAKQLPTTAPDLDTAVSIFETAACHSTYKMVEGVKAVIDYALKPATTEDAAGILIRPQIKLE